MIVRHTNNKENKSTQRRLLLVAYACSPYRGSEPGVGWHRALQAAKYYETYVMCEMHQFKEDIERYLNENGALKNLYFYFIPRIIKTNSICKFIYKFRPLYYLTYNMWHRRAYRIAIKLHQNLHFDIAHHVTLNGFREPGYLWRLNVPFVWGPVGGTQNYPFRFLVCGGLMAFLKEGIRGIINIVQLRFRSRVRKATKKASVVLVANSEIKKDFERVYNIQPIQLLETGLSTITSQRCRYIRDDRPLRLLWSGSFDHHKAFHLLVIALSLFTDSIDYRLRILGEGPLQRRWRRLTKKAGVDKYCTWLGWLPYKEAKLHYDWADLFVFTSLRDTSGNVVIEALSRGLPAVILDHQGVGDIVTENCGVKIPVTTPHDVITQLNKKLICIAKNKQILKTLSKASIKRAQDYLWSNNAEIMAQIYNNILLGK